MSLNLRSVGPSKTNGLNYPLRLLAMGLVLACGLVAYIPSGYGQGASPSVTASWTPLTNLAPGASAGNGAINMMLLSDGTAFVQATDAQHWLQLTPDAHGSYVNGTWTTLAPMSFPRIYFASTVLQDGRVWVLGGEYTGPYFDPNIAPSGEIYDPRTNSWSPIAPYPNEVGGCGHRTVHSDVQLTAGSPVVTGIYSTDRIVPGWTVAATGVPTGATVVSVDSTTQVTLSASATLTGPSTFAAFRGVALACFGDDPGILLSGGRILAGNIFNNSTYIYSVATNSWSQPISKYYNDRSDEEGWAHMSGGQVLTYDLFQSIATGQGYAELYDQAHNRWTGISPVDGSAGGYLPVLSSPALGFELGPMMRLQDGRAFAIGANQHTALYDQKTNAWSAGPDIHGVLSNPFGTIRHANFGADDAPAALMPNGHVIFAADAGANPINTTGNTTAGSAVIGGIPSTAGLQVFWSIGQADGNTDVIPPGTVITSIDSKHQIHISSNSNSAVSGIGLVFGGVFSTPAELFDFDPQEGSVSPVSPQLSDPFLAILPSYPLRLLVLPNGQVLFSDGDSGQLYIYTPAGGPKSAYLPVIQSVKRGEEGVYTLTGTQLNGPSDASGYGDDAQSNENFPIVRLQNAAGLVFYCRSRNWTSTGVGNVGQESVKFTLNPAVTPGDYELIVSAGGISSKPWPIHIPGHGD